MKVYCKECKYFDDSLVYEAISEHSKPDRCDKIENAEKVYVNGTYKREGYYKYIRAKAFEANKNNDCIYYDVKKKSRWWRWD